MTTRFSLQRLAPLALPLALLAVFCLLAGRSHGLPPFVFADEWLYSQASRLQPLGESILPSYLYLALFRLTSSCGTGFLDCARIANAALFTLAAPFIYLVLRPLSGRAVAALVALASVLAPFSSYTAYFMPEAMYFTGFWVLSWIVLAWRPQADWRSGLLAGAALGLLSLVKVHALFLLPALLAFMVWQGWRDGALRRALLAAAVLVAATLAVKVLVGCLLAGPAGLKLLGSFYGQHASNSSGNALARLLPPFTRSLYAHLMALGLLFGLPMLAAATLAAIPAARRDLERPAVALLVYTVLMLGAALGMTAAYTASIADAGPNEGLRLHLRYYAFVFPLLLALAAAALRGGPPRWWQRLALALPCALLLYWAALKLPFYPRGFIDSPELQTLATDPLVLRRVLAVQWLAMAAWVAWPALGRLAFLGLVLPFMAFAGQQGVGTVLAETGHANAYDRAGQFARRTLDETQRGQLSVAGADLAGLTRAQFHIDHAHSAAIALQPGAPFDATQLPARRQYLLVVGSHALPPGVPVLARSADYALLRLPPAPRPLYTVRFARPLADGRLAGLEGMSDPEHWGSWSNAGRVTLRFAQPLPRKLALFLHGRAYGPNVGQDFTLAVGSTARRFRLPAAEQEVFLQLPTDGSQHELTIDIPAPTRPAEAGGKDSRALGIGILSLEIAEQ